MKFYKSILICVFIAIQATNALSLGLHRFHTTLTRIDYNVEQKILEISIQLFTHDLEAVLKKKSGKSIELEKNAETDKLIFDYLNENFVLTDKKGARKALKWVGKESDADAIRVYVETEVRENPEGYKLKNTLFFESYPEQANLIVCRFDGKKADLLFKVGDKEKEISATKTEINK